MAITAEDMMQCASMIYVEGERRDDGTLMIGGEVVAQWPDSFDVAGVHFEYTDEERLDGVDDVSASGFYRVQACYFQQEP